MQYGSKCKISLAVPLVVVLAMPLLIVGSLLAQGVTTGAMSGLVTDNKGDALVGANVVAVHEPSGTKYGTAVRTGGAFNLPNMKIGGPYMVTASHVGYKTQKQENVYVSLGQDVRLDFRLTEEAIVIEGVQVTAEQDEVLNSDRTGAATFIKTQQVVQLPSVKRSTRDLTRLDPRSDGNFSFGGKNWLYNNISLDGSYFNNPFGLDDPAPGGQTNAEPVPFDAVEQVQVSVAPFDVREGGFTGAGINTVTKSGTNDFQGSVYRFLRNEDFLGNEVSGQKVVARPDLSFNQSGFTLSGPLIRNKLFFFVNGELERRDDPGTNFAADKDGVPLFGESRVRASTMDSIRARMATYGYETGPYEGFIHETNNNKLLAKLGWNINDNHNLTFRYNLLDAKRELPPHPFVLSFNNTGRGPNENSLPFKNSGYRINNDLNSLALEINSRSRKFANRFFASYNRFRDFREPFSKPFPTIEIGENGVQYTTVGHEPFSIHNILDQDVFQFTNNFSYFAGKHVFTVGANFERFSFFNSFNLFKYGTFLGFLPTSASNPVFSSLADFFAKTDPNDPNRFKFNDVVQAASQVPFKGEDIDVGQFAVYAQDEFPVSENFNLTYGLRVDFPIYLNDLVPNPYSTGLVARDENGNKEVVDQGKLPGATPLLSPRVGFNWDAKGDRSTQLRGGTGIFTGRVPFVWIGNNISNPGNNTNLDAHLRSFDLNAMDPDFKWPQAWTSNLAIDKKLPWDFLGTLEVIYGKDLNSVFVRNADLKVPEAGRLPAPDGRPYYGGAGSNELNADFGAGIYVIDNTDEGYNFNATAQVRKNFDNGLNTVLSYSYTQAKNQLKSTEIASVLWQNQPVQGNPNKPELGFSEFGQRHRVVGGGTYSKRWSNSLATHFGLFVEVAEGNRFAGAGGNRYSFIYSGDVNGDGQGGNDLIYIPRDATNPGEIAFADIAGGKTAQQQAQEFEAFIRQDEYLSSHRGEIAERFGGVNPWYSDIDVRILQDFSLNSGGQKHTFQLSLDILNVANLLKSGWGVRKVASAAATSPLKWVNFDNNPANAIPDGAPVFNFTGPDQTFIDDPALTSRWQLQIGLRYFFD